MTLRVLFFAFCLMLMPALAKATPQKIGIAVVVNDDIITFGDVDARTDLFVKTMPNPPSPEARAQMQTQIVERLIEEKIKIQEAKDLGIVITDAQVAEGFENIAKQNNTNSGEFRQRMRASGIKPSTLEDQIRADIAWSMVVRRKLRPQINVTDLEIESEISSINRGAGKKEFLTAEIFLNVPSPDKDVDALRKIEQIKSEIERGTPFQILARQFSEAPGAATGGDLGWIEEGQLEPTLDKALTELSPGRLSAPVRTDKGYHLLFLREMRQKGLAGSVTPPPAATTAATSTKIVTAQIKQILLPTFKDDPQVVTNAKISRATTLKNEITSCADMDTRMKDFISDGSNNSGTGDLGSVNIDTLPAALKNAAATLPIGTLSAPAVLPGGIAVIMVCDRQEQTVAGAPTTQPAPSTSNQPTRDDIANKIGFQRLEQLQARYLNDLRANASIERRI